MLLIYIESLGQDMKNWTSVMWKIFRKKEFITVILKDHSKRMWPSRWVWNYYVTINSFPKNGEKLKQFYDFIQIPNNSNKDEIGEFIEFEYKNHSCKFYGVVEAGRPINGDIEGVFFRESYKFLSPEKSIIIDIGANIADTAIYFTLNNAERVIALEPFPFSYRNALLNITVNRMKDKVEILNAGYGEDSEVKVEDKMSTDSSLLEISDDGKKINTYSLGTILNMYNLNNMNNLLLKMDCEGCEYNLINEPRDVLRKFKRIEMEFHYGYKNLESKLKEAGFSVHHSEPLKSPQNEPSLKKMALINKDYTIGMIYAERRPE